MGFYHLPQNAFQTVSLWKLTELSSPGESRGSLTEYPNIRRLCLPLLNCTSPTPGGPSGWVWCSKPLLRAGVCVRSKGRPVGQVHP